MPRGVHVAVVDPQVGTERRARRARGARDGRLLVGPDNGLLCLAWERCGGVELAVDVTRSPHRLEPVSATFHGRDLFAPVAAHLAAGAELADAGDPLDPETLATVELPTPRVEGDALVAHALIVDRFGNVGLNVGPRGARRHRPDARRRRRARGRRRALPGHLRAHLRGRAARASCSSTRTPTRTLAVAVNRGDAAAHAGARARRRGCRCGRDDRPAAALHLRADRLDQRARAGAGRGAARRTARSSPPTSRRAGRGRQGRSWTAPPGARGADVGDPARPRRRLLPLAAAVAVCEAGRRAGCAIKWPNDVWIDGRKLAGILVEGRPQEGWAVLGIGLNVDSPSDHCPTSCATAPPRCGSRTGTRPLDEVLRALLARLDAWLERPPSEVLAAWRERDALRGRAGALGRGRGGRRASTTSGGAAGGDRRRARRARRRRGAPRLGRRGRVLRRRPARASSPSSSASACIRRVRPAPAPSSPRRRRRRRRRPPRRRRALREVAQQLAGERRRLARHPHARAAQHLLGLRRVRQRGRQQRRRQPPVLLARRLHEPARVARVRRAGRVDEQPEQPLGLRPALHRVLLVHLAGVLGQAPEPGAAPGRAGRSAARRAPGAAP